MAPSALLAAMSPISPLLVRDIGADVGGVKNTFSSWDACMAKDYCKWPVIAAIIVGSLIAFSILFCIVRCCCCGMECCCAACACMNACCPSPRGGRDRTKYRDATPPPNIHHGYQPTPAPFYAAPTAPQFATFDTPKKIHADSLPAMPGWDSATSKKVLDDRQPEEMEMDKMDQHDEAKPMLAAASPHVGQSQYGQSPYRDQDTSYPPSSYRGQAPLAAGALATGALASRSQAGSAQGFNSNGQHPGMAPSQNSFGSSVATSQGYGQGRPQQNFAASGYAQHSQKYSQNGFQQNVNTGYGQTRSPNSDQQSYGQIGHGQTAYGQTNYGRTEDTGYNSGYGNTRPNQQDYNSHGYASSQSQSYGITPSAPQPTYNGNQQEYSRPINRVPIPSNEPRANGYPGQQTYQSYTGGNQSQNQWRDV